MSGPLVVPLSMLGAGDVAIAGGKGANLGELIRAGFSVPDGFVITTDAYAAAASAASIDPTDPIAARARLMEMAVPPEVATAVRDGYRPLGGRSGCDDADRDGRTDRGRRLGRHGRARRTRRALEVLFESGYFRAKIAQEKLTKGSSIAYSIVHATQFFAAADVVAEAEITRCCAYPMQGDEP